MSEQMTKYQTNNQIANRNSFQVIGADDLDRSDVAMPRMRVQQPTSQFGEPETAGQFYNTLAETFHKEIHAVVLRVSRGQVMWGQDLQANAPLCASNDGRVPRPDIAEPQSDSCHDCPMATWGADGQPPRCARVYSYLMSNTEDEDMPFLLSAMRTSAKAAKKLNSLIKMYGNSRRIVVSTEKVKGDKGQWYELRFKANGKLEAEDQERYAQIGANLAGVDMKVDVEETMGSDDFDDTDNVIDSEPLAF